MGLMEPSGFPNDHWRELDSRFQKKPKKFMYVLSRIIFFIGIASLIISAILAETVWLNISYGNIPQIYQRWSSASFFLLSVASIAIAIAMGDKEGEI